MAISRNITTETLGAGRRVAEDGGRTAAAKPPARQATATGGRGGAAVVPSGGASAGAVAGGGSIPRPTIPKPTFPDKPVVSAADLPFGLRPPVQPPIDVGRPIIPPFQIPPMIFQPVEKTTTQIAQGAISQLRGATPAVVREAINTIKNKNIDGDDLLNYLERRTRVGEVLNELANDWSTQTKQDFAEAFQMPNNAEKLPVMDAMVSIAILNDPDLKDELENENTTEASQADLLENRRIVWQWPQPGTPFTPPYVIVVAVDREDTTQAQNIIQSIIGDLVNFQGYKIPSAAANKLR